MEPYAHQHPRALRGPALMQAAGAEGFSWPEHINLNGCGLTGWPESIRQARRVQALSVYDNRLTDLPKWLWTLQHLAELRFLDLRANRLTDVPEWLAQLPRLEKLDLRWNQIDQLPQSFGAFRERGGLVYV